jgi:glyoxylase-like metal-dependent hydrolase (beta-lactamase superfamily II)
MINRRMALKGALGGLAAASLSPLAFAGPDKRKTARAKPTTTQVTDKIYLIGGVGGNVTALSTDEGLLLVDTGGLGYTRALQGQLKSLPNGKKVHTVFNTHWHRDQTGGNETFGKGGAKIVSQYKTKHWISTPYWVPAEDRYEDALPRAASPTETFFTTGKAAFGSENVEYGHLYQAHTDGDIYVYFRSSNVLVVGDAAAPEGDPVLDWYGGGWVGGRCDAQDLLLKLCNDQTKIIAGVGPVITRAQLQAEREMFQKIYDRIFQMIRKGMTWKDMLAAGAMEGLGRTFADPSGFMYAAHKGFWAHHNALSHDVV